ncbi:MAG: hypothetical protein HONBIEJF_02800 [Fimbriimonadaceae bacterium]|nr:hypothetical protein [Fimbriimonadaceae bacterium]
MVGPFVLDKLTAKLDGFTLPMGLTVDEGWIEAVGANVSADGQWSVSSPASVRLRISPLAVADYLNRTSPGGLRQVQVAIDNGLMVIDGKIRLLLEISATARCSLEIRDSKELHVVLESVDVGGVGAKGLVESQIAKVNPLFDVRDLPISVTLTNVDIRDDGVHLSGEVSPK